MNSLFADENKIINNIEDIETSNTINLKDGVYNVINAIIGVLGLVAVVVIIFGGVQYMTSAGDSGKVKKAKDTILYGVIGLIICIVAAAIVNFVVRNITGNGQQQSSGASGYIRGGYTDPNDCVEAGGQYIGGNNCFFHE